MIKLSLNKTQAKVRTGKYLSDTFPTQNGLKKRRCLNTNISQLFFSINN